MRRSYLEIITHELLPLRNIYMFHERMKEISGKSKPYVTHRKKVINGIKKSFVFQLIVKTSSSSLHDFFLKKNESFEKKELMN